MRSSGNAYFSCIFKLSFVTVPSEIESWLKANYVSQETCQRLAKELIRKMSDVKAMTEQDIVDLNLPLGERIRLRESIDKLLDRKQEVNRGPRDEED